MGSSQFHILVHVSLSWAPWPSPAAASLVFRFLLFASARGHEFEEERRPQCAEVDGQIGQRSCQNNIFAPLTDSLQNGLSHSPGVPSHCCRFIQNWEQRWTNRRHVSNTGESADELTETVQILWRRWSTLMLLTATHLQAPETLISRGIYTSYLYECACN